MLGHPTICEKAVRPVNRLAGGFTCAKIACIQQERNAHQAIHISAGIKEPSPIAFPLETFGSICWVMGGLKPGKLCKRTM